MPSVLDIRWILQSRREQKATDILGYARRLAADQSVDPDELLAAMSSAGVTDDELFDMVDMIRRRDELRRTAATQSAVEQEAAGIEAAIAKHRAVLDEAETRYRRAVEPLEVQLNEAHVRAQAAAAARASLSHPSNLPKPLVVRLQEARENLLAASTAAGEVETYVREQTARAAEAFELLEEDGGFDQARAAFDDKDRRQLLPSARVKLVEDVLYGRHRAKEATAKLQKLAAERDAAQAAFDAVQRECFEF